MQHLIHQQQLQLEIGSQAQAPDIQEHYRQLYWDKVLPRLDALFTELGDADVTLRFDRLEIDLGVLPPEGGEEILLQRLDQEVRQLIGESRSSLLLQMSPTLSVQLLKPPQWQDACLIHFLQWGILPWWAGEMTAAQLAGLLEAALEKRPEILLRQLRQHASPQLLLRLGRQFPPPLLLRLLSESEFGKKVQLAAFAESVFQMREALPEARRPASRFALHSSWLETALPDMFGQAAEKRMRSILGTMMADLPEPFFWHRMLQEIQKKPMQAPWGKQIEALLPIFFPSTPPAEGVRRKRQTIEAEAEEKDISGNAKPAPSTEEAKAERESKPADSHVDEGQKKAADRQLPQAKNTAEDFPIEAGIHLENAGLVILAPFFKGFFAKLGYTEEGEFVSADLQERAVLLTQYLVTGETTFSEHALPLNKLLCDWPLQNALAQEITPTAAERAEVDELLQSVRQYWQVLKNMSTEGIQRSFLKRAGKLSEQDHQYHLLVERSGVDILLEKLPWSIGLIRLPWMKKALSVEW